MDLFSHLQPDVSSLESSDEGNKSGYTISSPSGSDSDSGTGSGDSSSSSSGSGGTGSDSGSGTGSDSGPDFGSGSGSGSDSGTVKINDTLNKNISLEHQTHSPRGSDSGPDSRSGSGSGSNSDTVKINDTSNKNISLEHQTHSPLAESRDLTRLHVFGTEFSETEASQSTITNGFERRGDSIHPHSKIIQDKIIAALKLLTFREHHDVLVQFWSPHVSGKHQIIITTGQPFGLGVVEGQFSSYMKDSKHHLYVVDNDHEEGLNPPARVYSRGLPEWTSDVANYSPKHFPQQEHAIRCNVQGYLALPVFDLFTRSCVGVLEILTTTKFSSYAYEVQQVQSALERTYLTTAQAFDCPTINVNNEQRQREWEKISGMLKLVCDTHRLPLAQTWATSPLTTFASHEQTLKKSCNSFHTRCLGKDCIATDTLPFYVEDSRLEPFRKACGDDQHLDRSSSFVGKALLSRGSCLCDDITKLSVEEYPLAQFAHKSGLTSCFVIFLHSTKSNDDYVLEFFIPLHRENGSYEQKLVQTLKHGVGVVSEFELGDSIQVVGPVVDLSSNIKSATIQTASYMLDTNTQSTKIDLNTTSKSELLEMYSLYLDSILAKPSSIHVENKIAPQKVFPSNNGDSITDAEITDAGEKKNRLRRGRKRKIDTLTMEAVQKHAGESIQEAANSLGVSRSTLKRFCRENNMRNWPLTTKHAMQNRDHLAMYKSTEIAKDGPNDDWKLPELNFVDAFPKQIMGSVVSDVRKITVKATYKGDLMKFLIPVSSGLFELKNEVVLRFDLKSISFHLKYKDEDDDLIILASDADLHYFIGASNKSTIKVIIMTYD